MLKVSDVVRDEGQAARDRTCSDESVGRADAAGATQASRVLGDLSVDLDLFERGEERVDEFLIDVPAGDIIVELSGKRTLEAIVRDADNVELEGVQVNWSSEHAEIATVEAETGVVTGVSRGRTAVFASVGPVNGQVAVLVTSSPDRELELSTVGFLQTAWAWLRSANRMCASCR